MQRYAALTSGTRLGHYELQTLLGAGAMGEVYRATDTKLGRSVALKVLPPAFARDPERLARFRQEAKALAALDHSGVVTVYSVEQVESPDSGADVHFLTMQLVEGQSLDRVLPDGPLPLERLIDIGAALADALAAAHAKGIVHRDLKPANVMVATDGQVKVLDFGLAKAQRDASPGEPTMTSGGGTAAGVVMGTPAYMSPEQVEGRVVNASSDIFSLGIMLYEMATGRRPFAGGSQAALMSAILRDTPPPPSTLTRVLPRALDDLIVRCLDKESGRRPPAEAVNRELRGLREQQAPVRAPLLLRPRVVVAAVLVLAAVATYAAWSAASRNRAAVFVAESLPRIETLARDGDFVAAFELARAVERSSPAAVPDELWNLTASRVSVASTPAGATVTVRPFGSDGEVITLGVTPLTNARLPRGAFHWRVEAPGHVTAELVTGSPGASLRFDLRPANAPDADMVAIPAAEMRLWAVGHVLAAPTVSLGPYLIDRREVTNREFAAFVAAGGYTRKELWLHPFADGGRTLSFDEAMARFEDSTGRPGPAAWTLGSYPEGEDDLPVNGVSWYEAAAYAAFVGKELPTIYHWYQADTAGDIQLLPGLVLPNTNHDAKGPRPAGPSAALSAFGALDMAGNVREWSANASDGATRLALGGAWSDPAYLYLFPEARSPFDRASGNGLRCMKRLDPAEPLTIAAAPLPARPRMDRGTQRPVGDPEYAVYTRFFERRTVPLDARVESTDESSRHWIKQKVSFAAGYGDDRMTAWLYLPRSARPPYQVIIQMAGAATFYRRSSATDHDIFGFGYAEYLLRGGRAVLIPIWKGSYERSDGFHPLQSDWPSYREHVTQWVSEIRQSVDYLQSRDDVADDGIGYQGISNGAIWAPIFMALEPRIKVGVLLLGGFLVNSLRTTPMPPEIDALNYASRSTAPVLMMNSRHDAIFPYETAQVPLYKALGAPSDHKRHLVYPGGHSTFGWNTELMKESLDWLDRWFGPPAR